MARKPYEAPTVDLMIGGGDNGGGVVIIGSAQGPLNPSSATFSAWKMAVEGAGMDVDKSYEGYLKWMTENGYAAYIQGEDS